MTDHYALLRLAGNRPDFEELQHLVDMCEDVNETDDDTGDTALHALAMSPPINFVEMVKVLLDAGAHTGIRNKDGKRASDIAEEAGLGEGIVRLLR